MSFHTNFDKWQSLTDPANCPVCRQAPMPEGMIDLAELPHSWLNAEAVDCLKGACHLTSKYHGIELFDLTTEQRHGLMDDIAVCAQALKEVANAVKINYEIHGNSTPHLHVHLYPRYLNDPFPGQPIDYHQKTAGIYAPGEYQHFVASMKSKLSNLLQDRVKV
jgi:diadenosine tetraphosphate (Ap4A) HIT family hydrolase